LYVHCHGYDTTWEMRRADAPSSCVHPAGHRDAVRRLAQRAILVANSHTAAQRLLDIGIPQERVLVKPYGVPVPAEPPRGRPDVDGLAILYLGRLVDFKGPDLMIYAFEKACERGLKGHLTIAGDGPLRAMCELLRSRSKFRDRITLLGIVDAATGESLRASADVFTAHNCLGPVSGQEEAFGVSIVEAMSAGLPVVTGRSGGPTENIADGEDGLLVEPGDVEAHAEAFLRLEADRDLRERIGQAAWRKAKEFSCDRERTRLREILGINQG